MTARRVLAAGAAMVGGAALLRKKKERQLPGAFVLDVSLADVELIDQDRSNEQKIVAKLANYPPRQSLLLRDAVRAIRVAAQDDRVRLPTWADSPDCRIWSPPSPLLDGSQVRGLRLDLSSATDVGSLATCQELRDALLNFRTRKGELLGSSCSTMAFADQFESSSQL